MVYLPSSIVCIAAIIANTPQWASSCPAETHYQSCIAANLEEYRAFVRTAVRRYGPAGTNTINDWEIRVEANSNHGLLTKEQYVQELNAAYAVIKQEDPDAKVWGPEVVFHQNNGALSAPPMYDHACLYDRHSADQDALGAPQNLPQVAE